MISISTRVLSGAGSDVDRSVDMIRRFDVDVDGIEISFFRPDDARASSGGGMLSSLNKKFVRGLDLCTMHLPFKEVSFGSGSDMEYLRGLSSCYHALDCAIAVVHPDCVADDDGYEYLLDMFPGLSIENMTPATAGGEHRFGSTVADIGAVLSHFREIGLVLDYSHCVCGGDSFSDYERRFFGRVRELHMSASSRKNGVYSRHEMMHINGIYPETRLKNVPWVIEGKSTDRDEISAEIEHLRSIKCE